MYKGFYGVNENKMIKLSLDQLAAVEKRLQYMTEDNNGKYMQRVSHVIFFNLCSLT